MTRLAALLVALLSASQAYAAPITWEATGTISHVTDPGTFGSGPVLAGLTVGTPWTLAITFEPTTPGVDRGCSSQSFNYDNAILAAQFQLGAFTYANTGDGGDIFTNADLPYIGCGTSLGGPGLVQFHIVRGWSGGAGGPDLNHGLGLLLASYNDVNAVDGSLPSVPARSATQSALSGLRWDNSVGLNPHSQFTSSPFDPHAVPEPSSFLLLGTGLAVVWFASRRATKG